MSAVLLRRIYHVSRPMKARSESITYKELKLIDYPVVGSPKLDGFRALICKDGVHTASMKKVANQFTQKEIARYGIKYLIGLDGELIVGRPNDPDAFHNSSGPLRRVEGEPDFRFYVFDDFSFPKKTYQERWIDYVKDYKELHPRIVILKQTILNSPKEVIKFEKKMRKLGYEGIIIRSLTAPYKQGRVTFREGYIFKRKHFIEMEAKIIGFEEQMENTNKKTKNAMGLSTRSSHKSNLREKNTLGNFILKSKKWKLPFSCGTGKGLTDELRKKIWGNQRKYKGMIITFKYQAYGSIDGPRQPIFLRFRPKWDLSEKV